MSRENRSQVLVQAHKGLDAMGGTVASQSEGCDSQKSAAPNHQPQSREPWLLADVLRETSFETKEKEDIEDIEDMFCLCGSCSCVSSRSCSRSDILVSQLALANLFHHQLTRAATASCECNFQIEAPAFPFAHGTTSSATPCMIATWV